MSTIKDSIKVIQLDYYTDEVICEYESISQASKDNFISAASVCYALKNRGGRLSKKKLAFQYVDDTFDKTEARYRYAWIDRKTGEEVKRYISIGDISYELNIEHKKLVYSFRRKDECILDNNIKIKKLA